ncbi:MAG: hypothetical protein ABR555_15465 [Pyrinomonadaceae bacterium]
MVKTSEDSRSSEELSDLRVVPSGVKERLFEVVEGSGQPGRSDSNDLSLGEDETDPDQYLWGV